MAKMAAMPIYGKNHLKIFFSRTRRPMTLGLGMLHLGCRAYQVCSNGEPKLTLTYLMSRSNLLPNAFKWDFFWKFHFLKTVEAKVIILTWYVEPNETMAINKFQRSSSPLTYQPRLLILESHQNIVSSETTGLFELKFHMKTPYDRLAKIYTKCTGHMTKMATTPSIW